MAKDIQNRFVTPKAWKRIEQWSRRKPVFALMGEFSAGKSTLMNFLLRKQALPTQVTATQLPPVWFSYGNRSAYVKRHDGSTEDISLDQLESVGVNDAQFIRIFLEADILEAVDLIDTPGISDPKISTDVWQRAVGQANGVLWCTHATQAWRETERATWVSLPERLQHNSILLITRADALGQKDRQKVLRRVNREAGHLFNRSILFSARDAITARDKTGDAEMWARSGGGKMIDCFLGITEQIMDTRAGHLSRYQIDKSQSDSPLVRPTRPKRKDETAEVAPLQLVDPVPSEPPEVADQDSGVVTNFPVRPSRVERRSDEVERERINADEAERLRAEMVPTPDAQPAETEEDQLRAQFREEPKDPLDLSSFADTEADLDVFEFSGAEGEDENVFAAEVETPSPANDVAETAPEAEESEDLLVSLNKTLSNTPEVAPAEDTDDQPDAPGIEVSVSSITALMAEQSKSDEDDYEPEPETNGLVEVRLMPQPEPEEVEEDANEGLMDIPTGELPSAAAMWRELAAAGDLPTDAEGLQRAFLAFLAEFDQIAREHADSQTKEAIRSIPKAGEHRGAEWHVL
ncbi:dynamin family protein [Ruegeria sp. R13_0]|uniref:dynamin family protein n=1 Tax=Ruegeria sp. R13_0 TaxID=2821099 RepID=UPI001AD9E4D1|nr:dynamin family protein [Ruegeria sp. R13_0]MBO9434814.1 dynamin family protein [Ruegeria sp. R13_0]